jgi:hypothetical protein
VILSGIGVALFAMGLSLFLNLFEKNICYAE